MDGHVVLALARHVESSFLQRVVDVGAVRDDAVLDALHQVVPDQLARVVLNLQAGPQIRGVDVYPVAGLVRPGAGRVLGAAPPWSWLKASRSGPRVFCQPGGAMFRPFARLPVVAGGEDMHVDAVGVLVPVAVVVHFRAPDRAGPVVRRCVLVPAVEGVQCRGPRSYWLHGPRDSVSQSGIWFS